MVTTALYAGDTKIFNCIGSEEDCLALQGTLSNMEHWIKVNNNYCYSYNLDGVHLSALLRKKISESPSLAPSLGTPTSITSSPRPTTSSGF